MTFHPQKICLIITGGTALLSSNRTLSRVKKESDIPRWLEGMPEISLVAPELDIRLFHTGADADMNGSVWLNTARFMYEHRGFYRGFVILSSIDNIPYFAEALNLLFEDVNKSIVFTGSQIPDYVCERSGELEEILRVSADVDIRANLISAFQVVNHDIFGVHIIFGDKLIEGSDVELGEPLRATPFVYAKERFVGKVEFSIKLQPEIEEEIKARGHRTMRLRDYLETEVKFFEVTPLFNTFDMEYELKDARGAIFYLPSTVSYPEKLLAALMKREQKIPVLFCGRSLIMGADSGIEEELAAHGVFFMRGKTKAKMIVTFMWVLGQTNNLEAIKRMLDDAMPQKTRI